MVEVGRALHVFGVPAHRLEDSLARLASHLGCEVQVFSTPTALQLAFGSAEEQRTYLLRVSPGEVNLARLVEVDVLIEEVCSDTVTVEAARERLREIVAAPPPFGPFFVVPAIAIASAGAARFFNGGQAEVVTTAAIGLGIGLLMRLAAKFDRVGRVFELLAAFSASLAAGAAAQLFDAPWSPAPQTVMLASLIIVIPGYTLTVAMNELASRHLVSGTARFAGAATSFLGLGFGVALGGRAAEVAFGGKVFTVDMPPIAPLPEWTIYVALAVTPLTFAVLFQARKRDAHWILLAGILAFLAARFGADALGPELGTFVAALALGAGSNLLARLRRKPASVTLVPGLLLLVPGSLGFRSLSSFLAEDTSTGIDFVYRMLMVATALVAGLLFANFIVSPRRTL